MQGDKESAEEQAPRADRSAYSCLSPSRSGGSVRLRMSAFAFLKPGCPRTPTPSTEGACGPAAEAAGLGSTPRSPPGVRGSVLILARSAFQSRVRLGAVGAGGPLRGHHQGGAALRAAGRQQGRPPGHVQGDFRDLFAIRKPGAGDIKNSQHRQVFLFLFCK